MAGKDIDIFTGTLGKALGGGAGGYVAGKREAVELLVQRGRPTLFSNALPVTVACSAKTAIDTLVENPFLVQKLRDNVASTRNGIGEVGFEVLESPTAICPIIVGETATAISMSNKLLDMGVFAIGFGYPVVPEGTARIRVQISSVHEQEHIDRLCKALLKLKSTM
jgi:glycine C-acetyltransferase